MSTHNICFCLEVKKIQIVLVEKSALSRAMPPFSVSFCENKLGKYQCCFEKKKSSFTVFSNRYNCSEVDLKISLEG